MSRGPVPLQFRAAPAISKCSGTAGAAACRLRAEPSGPSHLQSVSIRQAHASFVRAQIPNCVALPSGTTGGRTSRALLRFAASLHYRLENLNVAGAAAQISRKSFADLRFGGAWVTRKKIHGCENHPRSADAALRAAMRDKSLLHRMQSVPIRNSFDGAY